MTNKNESINRMMEMQRRIKEAQSKEKEVIPVVEVETKQETNLPSKFLSLNEVKVSTKELAKTTSYLDKMRNINDQYEQIQMTEDQAKKVKRELLRLTTGVASVVPLNCKGHECHPKGTNILVSDGKRKSKLFYKKIEDLTKDDLIVPYNRNCRELVKRGKQPSEIATRIYDGFMHKFTNELSSYSCTHDHIVMAKLNPNGIGKYCIYMMQKGSFFRIGMTKLYKSNTREYQSGFIGSRFSLGITSRFEAEKADKIWIIDIAETKIDALQLEEYYSCAWGISKQLFISCLERGDTGKYNGKTRNATQSQIDSLFIKLNNTEEEIKAKLKSINLDFNYPLISREEHRNGTVKMMGGRSFFEIRACNFISNYMDMGMYTEEGKKNITFYKTSKTVENTPYNDVVYSLEIDNYHTYVANNFVTHNCAFSKTCVTGDTVVLGKKDKKIKDIEIGDIIYSFNLETKLIEKDTVTNKRVISNSKVYLLTTWYGNKIKLTSNHEVLTINSKLNKFTWKSIDEGLTKNDRILISDLDDIDDDLESVGDVFVDKILSIKEVNQEDVYDITVKKNSNFFANNVVVHNCSFFQEGVKDIVGKPCPTESHLLDYWLEKYKAEFNVDDNSLTDMHSIGRLCTFDIYEMRLTRYLSEHDQTLLVDFISSYDEQGNAISNKATSAAWDTIDKINRMRSKELKELMVTREAKSKLIKTIEESNKTNSISALKNKLEELIKLSQGTTIEGEVKDVG